MFAFELSVDRTECRDDRAETDNQGNSGYERARGNLSQWDCLSEVDFRKRRLRSRLFFIGL
jgi:hypothetical protein